MKKLLLAAAVLTAFTAPSFAFKMGTIQSALITYCDTFEAAKAIEAGRKISVDESSKAYAEQLKAGLCHTLPLVFEPVMVASCATFKDPDFTGWIIKSKDGKFILTDEAPEDSTCSVE